MKVFPDAKVKTLAECTPGQLLRSLEYGEGQKFGLAYEHTSAGQHYLGILLFEGEHPVFQPEDRPEQVTVLAYSGEVIFEVDQNGPLETNARNLFDVPGTTIADKDGWVLNVSSGSGYGRQNLMQFDLQTGRLEPYRERLSKVGIFGAWTVYLEEHGRLTQERIEISKFKVKKPI